MMKTAEKYLAEGIEGNNEQEKDEDEMLLKAANAAENLVSIEAQKSSDEERKRSESKKSFLKKEDLCLVKQTLNEYKDGIKAINKFLSKTLDKNLDSLIMSFAEVHFASIQYLKSHQQRILETLQNSEEGILTEQAKLHGSLSKDEILKILEKAEKSLTDKN